MSATSRSPGNTARSFLPRARPLPAMPLLSYLDVCSDDDYFVQPFQKQYSRERQIARAWAENPGETLFATSVHNLGLHPSISNEADPGGSGKDSETQSCSLTHSTIRKIRVPETVVSDDAPKKDLETT